MPWGLTAIDVFRLPSKWSAYLFQNESSNENIILLTARCDDQFQTYRFCLMYFLLKLLNFNWPIETIGHLVWFPKFFDNRFIGSVNDYHQFSPCQRFLIIFPVLDEFPEIWNTLLEHIVHHALTASAEISTTALTSLQSLLNLKPKDSLSNDILWPAAWSTWLNIGSKAVHFQSFCEIGARLSVAGASLQRSEQNSLQNTELPVRITFVLCPFNELTPCR